MITFKNSYCKFEIEEPDFDVMKDDLIFIEEVETW